MHPGSISATLTSCHRATPSCRCYTAFADLAADYESGALHPADLKPALAKQLNQILQPVSALRCAALRCGCAGASRGGGAVGCTTPALRCTVLRWLCVLCLLCVLCVLCVL